MNRFIYFILVLIQIGSTVCAQNKAAEIDTLVQSYASLNRFSGNILIAKGGTVIFQKSYGLADREWNIPNSTDTKFRIASLTKQFTAVLIMRLVESGKLNLSTSISEYLPYYRKDFGNRINVHHLLTHTAGLPEYTERPNFFSEISKREYTRKEFVEEFCSDTILFKPGTQYKYSNTDYYLLGAIIEEVTQECYAEVLQKNILDLVEMKNTGLEETSLILASRANGYNYNLGKYSNADYIDLSSTIFSAGAIYSTTGDLLLFDKALFEGKLLSQKSREMMFTPFLANYGYGVGITKFVVPGLNKEMHFIFHQGAINGFRSMMTHIVNEDTVVILLCNVFDLDLNLMNNAIFSILHNQPYHIPDGKSKE